MRAGRGKTKSANVILPPLPPPTSPSKASTVIPGSTQHKLPAASSGSRKGKAAGAHDDSPIVQYLSQSSVSSATSALRRTQSATVNPAGSTLDYDSARSSDWSFDSSDESDGELASNSYKNPTPDGLSGAKGYLYSPSLSFHGSGLGGGYLRSTDAADEGWAKFKSSSTADKSSSTSLKPAIQPSSAFLASMAELGLLDNSSALHPVDEMGYDDKDGDGDDESAAGTRKARTRTDVTSSFDGDSAGTTEHPNSKLPGQMCVEVGEGDARLYYGRFAAKLAANLMKWAQHSPFIWRGLLAKVRSCHIDHAAWLGHGLYAFLCVCARAADGGHG